MEIFIWELPEIMTRSKKNEYAKLSMQSDISSKISSNYIKNYVLQLSIHNISMNFALFCGYFYMGDIRNNDWITKKSIYKIIDANKCQ